MVLKKPKDTPEFIWQLGSGLVPPELRKILDQKFTTIQGADINGWSLLHFVVGGIFYLLGFSILGANIAHALWEIFQAYFNVTDLSMNSEWYDTLFDTLAFNAGYFTFAVAFQSQPLRWW